MPQTVVRKHRSHRGRTRFSVQKHFRLVPGHPVRHEAILTEFAKEGQPYKYPAVDWKRSPIPDAGFGTFAAEDIPEGEVVSDINDPRDFSFNWGNKGFTPEQYRQMRSWPRAMRTHPSTPPPNVGVVRNRDGTHSWVASRPIKRGEELLVDL